MREKLRVPCAYQGGKQRIASQIAELLIAAAPSPEARFYDLCCGSGAISIELVNRGVQPSQITMLDHSTWGTFWTAIGTGAFDMQKFEELLSRIPENKRLVKAFMTELATTECTQESPEVYPLLQASSFGGKQVWHDGDSWRNAFFRDYWEPTATSVRRSPANPMQPSPTELHRRVRAIARRMEGTLCLKTDIHHILNMPIPSDAVVYIDPPYGGTTGYGFSFDIEDFAASFRDRFDNPLFISEQRPLSTVSKRLKFGGANGGITGTRSMKHQEWISIL